MSTYFFDLEDGPKIRDIAGSEFSCDQDAISKGRLMAQEMAEKLKDRDPNWRILIMHESGREVFRLGAPVREAAEQEKAGLRQHMLD